LPRSAVFLREKQVSRLEGVNAVQFTERNLRMKGGSLAWDKQCFAVRAVGGTTKANTAKTAEKGGQKKRNGALQKS
jgi:hypothetical protein